MKWFHAADGEKVGPLEANEVHKLVRAQTIKPTTLAWHEGLAEWKPYAEIAADLEPEDEPFRPEDDEADGLEETEVATSDDPHAHLHAVLAEGHGFSVREAFARGWETVAHRPVLTIGVLALYFLGSMVASAAALLGTLLSAPLLAGAYWINLRLLRNEPATLADLLDPLKRCYLQLVLVQLLQGMVVTLLCFPFLKTQTMTLFGESVSGYTVDFFSSPAGWLALAALIYTLITLMFALPLVIDQGLRAWEAVVWSFRFTSRHFWKVLLFGILLGIFAMMGVIIFFFGFFLTAAISVATLCAAYVRLVTPGDSGAPLPPSSPAAAAPPDSPR